MTLMILISVICCASVNNKTSSFSSSNIIVNDDELVVAIEEMHRANYFTFIMLIKMATDEGGIFFRSSNVTFLMPNDRMLSNISLPENAVTDFLLRHSIPSPLLFDNLQLIPTGSLLPSSKPGYILHISNNGRKNYSVNSVKIISPNICSSSTTTIRCHGIAGVLFLSSSDSDQAAAPNPTLQLPSCPQTSTNIIPSTSSPVIISAQSPFPIPIRTNPNSRPQNSGASHISPLPSNLSRLSFILLQYFSLTSVLLHLLSIYTTGY